MHIYIGTFMGIGLASFGILIIGILDDKWGLPPVMKMLGQLGCALVVIGFGMTIPFFSNPFGGVVPLYVLAIPLTLFWIVGVTNAVNLIDGLDGLAAGLSTIAGITLFFVALRTHQVEAALLLAGVVGATLGFLRFNFYPATIFLGDSGSLLLGFLLSTAAVLGVLKSTLVIAFMIPMLALGIPIFDTASAIMRRIRIGAHPFQADQHHLHHLMLAQGLTQRGVVLILYAVALFLCGGALLITAYNKEDALWVIVGLIAMAMMLGQMVWLKLHRAVKEASRGA
jgi:UDP-GlcNAc:undecaprenyl-phosphate GlcNAc-1-phosphate transferase